MQWKVSDLYNSETDFCDSSFTFMRNIRGTMAYWKDQLAGLLARIRTLGPPTFFITLSANDMAWTELYCHINPCLSLEDAEALSSSDKWEMMRTNPVLCATYFHRRMLALLQFLKSEGSPFKVSDHWVRIEFQMRGSPHLHIFLRVENVPLLDTPEGRAKAPNFIDKYVSTCLPDENTEKELSLLVKKLQTHSHTFTCQKGGSHCRFFFPRPISEKTCLKHNVDVTNTAQFYVTKRSKEDIYINAYNPCILKLWQSNMDIQMVGSRYGAAYYVCKYIAKSEPQSIREAVAACIEKMPDNISIKSKLSKIGSVLLGHRTVSAQEVAYRLCGYSLVHSSRVCVWVNSRLPQHRRKILKPQKELKELSDDSTDIFVSNVVEYYSLWPHLPEWESMSLAMSATWYNVLCSPTSKECVKLHGCEKWARKRSCFACLRTPYIPKSQNEEYLFSVLFLFYPWRKESELTNGYKTVQESFIAKQDHLDKACEAYSLHRDTVTVTMQRLQLMQMFSNPATDTINNITVNSEWVVQISSQVLQTSLSLDVHNIHSLEVSGSLSNNYMTDEEFHSSMAKFEP